MRVLPNPQTRSFRQFIVAPTQPLQEGSPPLSASERLPQSHEVLRRLEARSGVEIPPYVETHGTHGRVVSEPESNRVRVVVQEFAEIDRSVYVTAVIEDHAPEPFLDRNRKPSFGVEDKQGIAPDR